MGEFDGPIHAEIRSRPLRKLGVQRHVYGHGPIHYRRINAHNVTRNYSVMCIDGGWLSDLNVFRLGLRNLQLRLQPLRLNNFRERGTGRHELSNLQSLFLQDSIDPGTHSQVVELALLQLCQGAKLFYFGLFRLKLRFEY